ncbi:QWRF motif-containing protein 7 [Senna tora]|uniref:QWRF motif-containing protein 7 n=1 Tax=Senna tora TaxID=362788 RepID=A0A835CAT4_9FABA|nr:QWRF motif-containing protein 7 [Senna tora]
MEKENNGGALSGRRNLSSLRSTSPSPRLCRSKSGGNLASMTATTPENNTSRRFGSSQRFATSNSNHNHNNNNNRSKSTSRTRRTQKNEENLLISSAAKTKSLEISTSRDINGFGKFLQRGVSPDTGIGASKKAATLKSPSAWALSPGRFLGSPAVSESPGKTKSGGGGVGKVLKYFRQKKVSSVQEEEYHRYRILHNRLLQWRFVNAKAHAAMANVKKAVEINIFSVWLKVLFLRKMIVEKKMEMQKLKQRIKLYQILIPQLCLLNEWPKLEKKNEEYVKRMARKLSALSICLPLHDLKADEESVYKAMKTATQVMESIHLLITKYQTQVERILYQVTELTTISKQQEEYFQELHRIIPTIASSLENEKSIMVHLLQTKMELKRGHHFWIAQTCRSAGFRLVQSNAILSICIISSFTDVHPAPAFLSNMSLIPSLLLILDLTQSTMLFPSPNSASTDRFPLKISINTTP